MENANMARLHGGYQRDEMVVWGASGGLKTYYVVYRNPELPTEEVMSVQATGVDAAERQVIDAYAEEEGVRVSVGYVREAPNDFTIDSALIDRGILLQYHGDFEVGQWVFWGSPIHDQRGIYRVIGFKERTAHIERHGLLDTINYTADMGDLFLVDKEE